MWSLGGLIVSGEREVDVSYWDGAKTGMESRPQRIFRVHNLPVEVSPSTSTAILRYDTPAPPMMTSVCSFSHSADNCPILPECSGASRASHWVSFRQQRDKLAP